MKKVFLIVFLYITTSALGTESDLYLFSEDVPRPEPNIVFLFDTSGSMEHPSTNICVRENSMEIVEDARRLCRLTEVLGFDVDKTVSNFWCHINIFEVLFKTEWRCGRFVPEGYFESRLHYLKKTMAGSNGVIDKLLEQKRGINVAVANFPYEGGAKIISPFITLNRENAQSLKAKMWSLRAGGNTPMGNALLDIWDLFYTQGNDPKNEKSHLLSCRENAVFLITDGEPVGDNPRARIEKYWRRPYYDSLKNYLSNNSSVIDVAEYIYRDLWDHPIYSNDLYTNIKEGDNCSDMRCDGNRIRIYPVSYMEKVPTLVNLSKRVESSVLTANSENGLTSIITEQLRKLYMTTPSSASPPLVTINSDLTSDRIITSIFKPASIGHWHGNLRSFCLYGEDCLYERRGEFDPIERSRKVDRKTEDKIREQFSGEFLSDVVKENNVMPLESLGTNEETKKQPGRNIYFNEYLADSKAQCSSAAENGCSSDYCDIGDGTYFLPVEGERNFYINVDSFSSPLKKVEVDLILKQNYKDGICDLKHKMNDLSLTLFSPKGVAINLFDGSDGDIPEKLKFKTFEEIFQGGVLNVVSDEIRGMHPDKVRGPWRLRFHDRDRDTYLDWGKKKNCEEPILYRFAIKLHPMDSVCGNGIFEPGECCEKGDTVKCSALGSESDKYSLCNSSCEGYDITQCVSGEVGFRKFTTEVASTDNLKKLYNYLQGFEYKLSENKKICDNLSCIKRRRQLGDFFRSTPLPVEDKIVVGSNAGLVEVFNLEDGKEFKGFIPKAKMKMRYLDESYILGDRRDENMGIDSTPLRVKGSDYDYILFGYGRGAEGFSLFSTKSVVEDGSPELVKDTVDGVNLLYNPPAFTKWKGTDMLITGSGYRINFDDDEKRIADSSGDIAPNLFFYSVSKEGFSPAASFETAYPVVAPPAPYLSSLKPDKQYDFSYIMKSKKESDALFFADIGGNIYHTEGTTEDETEGNNSQSPKKPLKVFTMDQRGTTNETDINIFSKPVVMLRGMDKKEIWVASGTNDPTRPIMKDHWKRNIVFALRYKNGDTFVHNSSLNRFFNATGEKSVPPDIVIPDKKDINYNRIIRKSKNTIRKKSTRSVRRTTISVRIWPRKDGTSG